MSEIETETTSGVQSVETEQASLVSSRDVDALLNKNGLTMRSLMEKARNSDVPVCHKCGEPQSKNPHPDAGKPDSICEVGAVWECIPCLVLNRHVWARRAWKAENERDVLQTILRQLLDYYKTPYGIMNSLDNGEDGIYHPKFTEAIEAAKAAFKMPRARNGDNDDTLPQSGEL